MWIFPRTMKTKKSTHWSLMYLTATKFLYTSRMELKSKLLTLLEKKNWNLIQTPLKLSNGSK
jgi:hypothetical protein